MSQQYHEVIRSLKAARGLETMTRDRLLNLLVTCRDIRNAWLKYQILVNRRTDILANLVLGYQVIPTFHLPIIQHQAKHPQSLTLGFRGGGKTTIATISEAIILILRNPNIRILIASKVLQNAQDILKEIKGHFENNQTFREVFGDWVGRRQWDERSIEVNRRTMATKEPTIMTVGVDGAVASKHYDVLFPDDLVEEDNSRTEHMRNRLKKWYYNVLLPCLEPPDAKLPDRGLIRASGTRYDPDDLYSHWTKNEFSKSTLTLPAIMPNGESAWADKFPLSFLESLKQSMGVMLFNAQYQCDCEAMKGEIFVWEHFQRHNANEYPNIEQMKVYQGVDLAIGEKQANDLFAQVVIGIKDDHIWTLDYEESRLRFSQQTDRILRFYNQYEPIWCGVEGNQYQTAQLHNLKDKEPNFRGLRIITMKDKRTRAWNLTPLFEQGKVHFKHTQTLLMERLLRFPNHKRKDLFDAFDFAIQASRRRARRKRESVGLI